MCKNTLKKKQYTALKILYCEDYIDMFRTVKIQNNQKALKFEIILKTDSDALSSQSVIDDLESLSMLRDLSMSDWSIRKVSALREKKLFKKIKACALEALKKLLTLLMSQKVENITVKNILDASLLVHWMIFQNLSWEIKKEANEKMHVLFKAVISRWENEFLNELWVIKIMKF